MSLTKADIIAAMARWTPRPARMRAHYGHEAALLASDAVELPIELQTGFVTFHASMDISFERLWLTVLFEHRGQRGEVGWRASLHPEAPRDVIEAAYKQCVKCLHEAIAARYTA